jgi:hypothetical protein
VVDVRVIYEPVLNTNFFPPKIMTFSAYYPVRNTFGGVFLPWDGVNDFWTGTKCAGYP